MEVLSMPVISTCHLDKATNARLTAEGDENPWITCAEHEYGYFMHLNEVPEDAPKCLRDISQWLKDNGHGAAAWVRLDQAADMMHGLPAYDWGTGRVHQPA